MSEAIQQAIQAHPWPGLLLVVLMAWLEYIFPPVPGDSTMLFACFLAGTGMLPLGAVVAACLLGSVAGAGSAWAIGRRLGRSYFFLRSDWARHELGRLEAAYRRYGPRLLAVNRFLPGLRGFFLYGAGIGRLDGREVMIYSTLSNVLWVGLIVWGGTSLGASWQEVRLVFQRYVYGIAAVLALYAVVTLVQLRRRRRRAAMESLSGGP
ncbi:MAG TPA: DedA family protein [Candidatus Polarisedimenticolia bacterium]|nr:DedA family protein [Candidatus Polarisedimenticolia bacterium]